MLYCDYCGKSTEEVKRMIAGINGAAICDKCVIVCMEVLCDEIIKDSKEIQYENNKTNKCRCSLHDLAYYGCRCSLSTKD